MEITQKRKVCFAFSKAIKELHIEVIRTKSHSLTVADW